MATLSADQLLVRPGQGEKTSADMVMIFRSRRLAGHFSIMEGEVRPNELLGFHTHANEDQHMVLLSGELQIEVGGAEGIRFTARAGDHVLKPRGITHGFWNMGSETARYVETSTQDGFERFIDARAEGLGHMLETASAELGMSFELERSVEVIREHGLTGMAGAKVDGLPQLLRDPAMRRTLRENPAAIELFFELGGARIRKALSALR